MKKSKCCQCTCQTARELKSKRVHITPKIADIKIIFVGSITGKRHEYDTTRIHAKFLQSIYKLDTQEKYTVTMEKL